MSGALQRLAAEPALAEALRETRGQHIAERRAQLRVRSRSLLREQQFMQVELRQPVDAQVVLRLPERRDLQDRGPAEPALRQQQAGAKRCAVDRKRVV